MESATSNLGMVDIFVYDSSGSNGSLGETLIKITGPFGSPGRSARSQATRTQATRASTQSAEPAPPSEQEPRPSTQDEPRMTEPDGHYRTKLAAGINYRVEVTCFGLPPFSKMFDVHAGCPNSVDCPVDVGFEVKMSDASGAATGTVKVGRSVFFELSWPANKLGADLPTRLTATLGTVLPGYTDESTAARIIRRYLYHATAPGRFTWTARLSGGSFIEKNGDAMNQPDVQNIAGKVGVNMGRTATAPTDDLALWQAILNSTEQLSFNTYMLYMDNLFCGERDISDLPGFEQARFPSKRTAFDKLRPRRLLPFTDSDAYRVVKAATEAFVMVNCGTAEPRPFDEVRDANYFARRDLPFPAGGLKDVFENYLVPPLSAPLDAPLTSDPKILPYLAIIRAKLPDIAIKLTPFEVDPDRVNVCHSILQEKLANPCLLELIWSYWHEEGMLVQTMNAITRRFQNVRGPAAQDPLSNLEIDPLRPLNNLLWGYLQDEQHRLSVVRRNYEYDHHYGLRLQGKAVQNLNAADSRSKFIEAFHNLLRLCAVFFRQDDDTTIKADAFPILHALKEVHLILSQGAHNQFGDLTSTARIEMLMQAWLLARPEFREFLPTRIMVAYPEPWMDRVDAMKKLQGWTDTSVIDFRNLALFGEQALLSIRYGNWSDIQDSIQAFNWARFFRPQLQGYIHAYRAVSGVDLAADTAGARVDATLPSVLLQKRLTAERSRV